MKNKILYLYSEIVGYQIPVLELLTKEYNCSITVIHWDKNKLKPYSIPEIENVNFINRSHFKDSKQLLEYCLSIQPDLIYISGWMDKQYLKTASIFKKKGIKVVSGFDDIWRNTIRQKIGSFVFPIIYKKYFSHAWVAGVYQFEFAKKLGFKNDEIIFDLLTANTQKFKTSNFTRNDSNRKSFLYVGNFRKVKGFDILLDAFKIYKKEYSGDWKLICVGNGELEHLVTNELEIEMHPFSSENELLEIAKKSNVFILPSRLDQWGVVVHEFASIGFPLILSENVGSKSTFLIENFNGFTFSDNSPKHLAFKMNEISLLNENELIKLGYNSIILSKRIGIESSAASFMSLLNKTKL